MISAYFVRETSSEDDGLTPDGRIWRRDLKEADNLVGGPFLPPGGCRVNVSTINTNHLRIPQGPSYYTAHLASQNCVVTSFG